MESEGPYTVTGMDDGFGVLDSRCKVVVAGEATVFANLEDAEKCERLANSAHAEGRKAAEKELKELLELANHMRAAMADIWIVSEEFDAWKKARGIE